MTLARAVMYRLFAGQRGNPRMSLYRRMALLAAALIGISVLMYHLTPQLTVRYPLWQVIAGHFCVSTASVLFVGLVVDAPQRAFLTKLYILRTLPVSISTIRKAYASALLPVNLLAVAAASGMLLAAYRHAAPLPLLIGVCLLCCAGGVLGDIVLRLSQLPLASVYLFRHIALAGLLYVSHFVFKPAAGPGAMIAAGIIAMAYMVAVYCISCLPMRYEHDHLRLPVYETTPGIWSELGVRAVRIIRYIGTNIVLALAVTAVVIVAHVPALPLPVDGLVLITLLLIGTIGQEVRTISSKHYPVELVYYGTLWQWVAAGCVLAFVQAVAWIGLCLTVVWWWAPHGLSVSFVEAALLGLGFTGAGITAGSLIVPDKRDMLAQCASTAIYAALLWGILKLTGIVGHRVGPLLLTTTILVSLAIAVAYWAERLRWYKTIRR